MTHCSFNWEPVYEFKGVWFIVITISDLPFHRCDLLPTPDRGLKLQCRQVQRLEHAKVQSKAQILTNIICVTCDEEFDYIFTPVQKGSTEQDVVVMAGHLALQSTLHLG